jgi:Family of unknown function (DUF5455)
MPLIVWLGGVIAAFFAQLFVWFSQYVVKRVAIIAAAITIIGIVTTAFFASVYGLVSSLSLALPSEYVSHLGLFLPGNVTACLTIILSAKMLRFAYDMNIRIIQMKVF